MHAASTSTRAAGTRLFAAANRRYIPCMCRWVTIIGLAAAFATASAHRATDSPARRGDTDHRAHHAHMHWHHGHAHTHWHSHDEQHANAQADLDTDHEHAFNEHGPHEQPVVPPIARIAQVKDPTSKTRMLAQSVDDVTALEPPSLPPPKPPPKPADHNADLPQLRTVILLT